MIMIKNWIHFYIIFVDHRILVRYNHTVCKDWGTYAKLNLIQLSCLNFQLPSQRTISTLGKCHFRNELLLRLKTLQTFYHSNAKTKMQRSKADFYILMSGQFCTLVMFEFSSALPSCIPQTISIIKRAFFSCNFTTSLLQCSKILTDYMIGYVGFALLLWILQPFSEWNLIVSDMIVALYQILHNTCLIDGESFQSLITVLIDISNYHTWCYIDFCCAVWLPVLLYNASSI